MQESFSSYSTSQPFLSLEYEQALQLNLYWSFFSWFYYVIFTLIKEATLIPSKFYSFFLSHYPFALLTHLNLRLVIPCIPLVMVIYG